jgi:hypothetical protein
VVSALGTNRQLSSIQYLDPYKLLKMHSDQQDQHLESAENHHYKSLSGGTNYLNITPESHRNYSVDDSQK